jgi:Zn-dependent peptidase ImmA (M78 family)
VPNSHPQELKMHKIRPIEVLANQLRDKFSLKFPLKAEDLAKKLNAKIVFEPHKRDVDSEIYYSKKEKKFIVSINKLHSDLKTNFEMVHQLGHLVMHYPLTTDFVLKDNYRYDKLHINNEVEAKEFALSILMPCSEFIRVSEKYYDKEKKTFAKDKIAEHFAVKESVVTIRGTVLKLW